LLAGSGKEHEAVAIRESPLGLVEQMYSCEVALIDIHSTFSFPFTSERTKRRNVMSRNEPLVFVPALSRQF
jgi:hypothetical protein